MRPTRSLKLTALLLAFTVVNALPVRRNMAVDQQPPAVVTLQRRDTVPPAVVVTQAISIPAQAPAPAQSVPVAPAPVTPAPAQSVPVAPTPPTPAPAPVTPVSAPVQPQPPVEPSPGQPAQGSIHALIAAAKPKEAGTPMPQQPLCKNAEDGMVRCDVNFLPDDNAGINIVLLSDNPSVSVENTGGAPIIQVATTAEFTLMKACHRFCRSFPELAAGKQATVADLFAVTDGRDTGVCAGFAFDEARSVCALKRRDKMAHASRTDAAAFFCVSEGPNGCDGLRVECASGPCVKPTA